MSIDKVKKVKQITIKRVDPRYITYSEDIFNILDIYERSVYQALRYASDYSAESSTVQMSVPELCEISKIGKTKVHQCLNSLEHTYFLIKRTNTENFKYGQKNHMEVASRLNYFKLNEQQLTTHPPHEPIAQYLPTHPPHELPRPPHELPPSATRITNTINTYINLSTTTTVVVVNLKTTQKLLEAYKNRKQDIDGINNEDDFLSACQYWIDIKPKNISTQGRVTKQIQFILDGTFYPHDEWLDKNKKQTDFVKKNQNGLKDEDLSILIDYKHALKTRQIDVFFPDNKKRQYAENLYDLYNAKFIRIENRI